MIFSDSRRPYLNKFFKKIKKRLETKRKKNSCCEKQNATKVRLDFSNRSLKWDSNESAKFLKRQVCLSKKAGNSKLPLRVFFSTNLIFLLISFSLEIRVERFVFSRSDWISVSHNFFLNKKSCRWAEKFTCVVKLLLNSAVYVRNSFRPT